ncbi:MAG: Tim44/TimA family putative adaptor protein [Pseudomonadota bacterium]
MDILQILFFAGLAVFFAVRLYMLLGKPTGRSPEEHAAEARSRELEREVNSEQAPIELDERRAAGAFSGPAGEGLSAIAGTDPSFDPGGFMAGARQAYEMILTAFADGDRDTLKTLLAPKVFAKYDAAITAREEAGQELRTEVERLVSSEFEEASLNANRARVKVRFTAELASETRDSDGQRIAGDLSRLDTVREIWSFERDVSDANPNWALAGVKPAPDSDS